MSQLKPIAIFGGTFDPIHYGHLRMALEMHQQFDLQEVRLVPCQQPVITKSQMPVSAEHRLRMLQIAVENQPGLSIDQRELQRTTPSYTLTTLESIRREIDNQQPLWLAMGCDTFLQLPQWHRWQELLSFAHIIVLMRPTYTLPTNEELLAFLNQHQTQDITALKTSPNGKIFLNHLTLLDISATFIRQQLANEQNPRFLLPDNVLAYIQQHGLYHKMRT